MVKGNFPLLYFFSVVLPLKNIEDFRFPQNPASKKKFALVQHERKVCYALATLTFVNVLRNV